LLLARLFDSASAAKDISAYLTSSFDVAVKQLWRIFCLFASGPPSDLTTLSEKWVCFMSEHPKKKQTG